MAATNYSKSNAKFTELAHECAREQVYPKLFSVGKENLEIESTLVGSSDKNSILDGEMAVDRIAKVKPNGLSAPLTFTIQERFRKIQYRKWRDITITEFNHSSGLPSELYKINAGIFLYGYYDHKSDVIAEAFAVSVTDLLMRIANNTIKYTKGHNPRSNQSFICFSIEALRDSGMLLLDYNMDRDDPWHVFYKAFPGYEEFLREIDKGKGMGMEELFSGDKNIEALKDSLRNTA